MTEGRYAEAFTQAAWPGAREGTGNYRPVVLSSLALEWSVWRDAPFGYHAVNVLAHALVCLLLLSLLACLVDLRAALVGALFFAVHPVHTEAVANVMGRAELYAAIAYLGACLLYLKEVGPTSASRAMRLTGLIALYLLAVGSKEIAVTLPAMAIALEVFRRSAEPLGHRLRRESLTYVALFGTLACYVLVRWSAVGAVTGQGAAAGLFQLDTASRMMSALTVWPHYLRLFFFPLDLSADYSPAVLVTTSRVNGDVLLGLALLVGTMATAVLARTRAPVIALGCAWFIVAISPVSNLVVRSDVLLAERILYLPSIAAALVVAAVATEVLKLSPEKIRMAGAAAVLTGALLTARTVSRNPTWLDTFTVLSTLQREHPESWMSQRARAVGLERIGEVEEAASAWETALELAPEHYQVLVESAVFFDKNGEVPRSEALLMRAASLIPDRPEAYGRLAERRIRRGDGRGAHEAALRGVARSRADRELWALVSETYVMKADLAAAVRARRASIGVEPTSAGWTRLADLLDALDQTTDADAARVEAARIEERGAGRARSDAWREIG